MISARKTRARADDDHYGGVVEAVHREAPAAVAAKAVSSASAVSDLLLFDLWLR